MELCYYNNPLLRQKSREVELIDDEIRAFCEKLLKTMKKHKGVGLAAPQVGKLLRIFIGALGDDEKGDGIEITPQIYINPVISNLSKKSCVESEGCLSIPNTYINIRRPVSLDITAYDEKGNLFTKHGVTGWQARNLLHENDHLNGVLHIDHLSASEREKLKSHLEYIDLQHNPRGKKGSKQMLEGYFSGKKGGGNG